MCSFTPFGERLIGVPGQALASICAFLQRDKSRNSFSPSSCRPVKRKGTGYSVKNRLILAASDASFLPQFKKMRV